MKRPNYDVAIIGAGVIGGMLARALSKYQISVALLEKEHDVACGASKANSGIVHGGFDPEPGTHKAVLNAPGIALLYQAAEELNVPYRKNGSMVCAFGAEEEPALRELYQRGLANGVTDMELLRGDEARAMEPNLSPDITAVLRIPTAGIICPYQLTIAAVGNAMDNGVSLYRDFAVSSIEHGEHFTIRAQNGEAVTAGYLVNCAGGQSDHIAAMAGDGFFTIMPRAGEYMLLDRAVGNLVSHTIFQVPSKAGKGVLVSPTADGNLLIGPTATPVATSADTQTTADGLQTALRLAQKSVPSVSPRSVITSFTGVRASERNGDFILQNSSVVPRLTHVAAIDSPGLSCAAAIAEHVTELLRQNGLALTEKADWNPRREDPHRFQHMTLEQKDAFIKKHPDYGRVVCRCEGISEGEIRAAIRNNPPARDIDSVKRRTRSGMGRCQGGFCMPYVMRLIAEETGTPMEQVTKKGENSEQLVGKI